MCERNFCLTASAITLSAMALASASSSSLSWSLLVRSRLPYCFWSSSHCVLSYLGFSALGRWMNVKKNVSLVEPLHDEIVWQEGDNETERIPWMQRHACYRSPLKLKMLMKCQGKSPSQSSINFTTRLSGCQSDGSIQDVTASHMPFWRVWFGAWLETFWRQFY